MQMSKFTCTVLMLLSLAAAGAGFRFIYLRALDFDLDGVDPYITEAGDPAFFWGAIAVLFLTCVLIFFIAYQDFNRG